MQAQEKWVPVSKNTLRRTIVQKITEIKNELDAEENKENGK